MDFKLTIAPAIAPKTRHEIEAVLTAHGYDVHGGGTYIDMSECDITFSRDDPRDKE